jgi:hypothetical protein
VVVVVAGVYGVVNAVSLMPNVEQSISRRAWKRLNGWHGKRNGPR